MRKLREKWIWALCLAILVHIGVFFIFYLNIDKDSSRQINRSSQITNTIKTTEPLTTIDTSNNQSPSNSNSNSKIYTTTLKNDKIINDINSSSEKTKIITPEKELSSPSTPTNDKVDSIQVLRDDNNLVSTEAITSVNNQTVNTIKNEAALLATDVPIQREQVKLDKEYLSMKSEVEEVNNRLSAAINEVKKRNQQKIDQIEQQKTGTDISAHEDTVRIPE
ncbi:hypothetical protein ACI2IV_11070 [Psychrobacter faecalis]